MYVSSVSRLESLEFIPTPSGESRKIFQKYGPQDFSITDIAFPGQSIICLKEARERLREAKEHSARQKLLSLVSSALTVGVIAGWAFFPFEPKDGKVGLACLLFPYVNGTLADHLSGNIVAKDSDRPCMSAWSFFDYGAFFAVPFYPFVAVKRMYSRVSNLQNRIKHLEEKTNQNHAILKDYFIRCFETIKEGINQEKSLLTEDLGRVSEFHSAFSKEKLELEAGIRKLEAALQDLEEMKSFYQD